MINHFKFSLNLIMLSMVLNLSAQDDDKILIVTSNQHTYGATKQNAANHFAEIVLAYDVFVNAGYQVDFISPQGGAIPLGYIETSNGIQKKYLYDATFMSMLKNTMKPSEVKDSNYSAIYYSGGGAAMFGVPENTQIQQLAFNIYNNKGIVSAVCHGTAGIVNIKNEKGDFLFIGKKINGYPDKFERRDAPYYKTFPFSIQHTITQNGGEFKYSEKGWDGFYVVDGRLITGQDPTATTLVAKAVIDKLMKSN